MNHIDWMISNALKNVTQVCLTVDRSDSSVVCTNAAKLFIPRRISVTPAASHTWVLVGSPIVTVWASHGAAARTWLPECF
jgi:hypothetical protein